MSPAPTVEQQPWWWKHPGAAGDALFASTAMCAAHKLVVWAIMRRTVGNYNKSEAAVGHSVIQSMTGLSARHVSRLMRELTDEGVLTVIRPATFASAAVLTFNPDSATWGRFSVTGATVAPADESAPGDTMSSPPPDMKSPPPRHHVTTPPDTMSPIEESFRSLEDSGKILTGADTAAPNGGGEFSAGDVVRHAADFAKDSDITITANRRARIGKAAKELLAATPTPEPEHVKLAVERLVLENGPPTALEYILGDIQRERGGHNGRSREHRDHRRPAGKGRSADGEF